MPRKSKNRKNNNNKRKRRNKFSKLGSVRNYQTIQTFRQLVPDRLRVALPVSTFLNYSFTSSNFADTYAGNNIKSPGLGDWLMQPLGYAQYITLYQKYVVTSSTISLEIVNGSADEVLNVWCALYPSRTSTPIGATVIDAASQPYVRNGFVGSVIGSSRYLLKNSMSTSKLFGFNCITERDFSGDAANPPALPWYWILSMSGTDNDPIFPTVQVLLKIVFHVEFFDRNIIAQTNDS